jgi:hypothetical protein
MKKTLIALAALAATSAFAQSTVTMAGGIMYGMSTATTGINTYGAWKGDRNYLNIAATEDLGGGLKVTAQVHFRYNSGTGNTGGYVSSTTGDADDNLFEQTSLAVDSPYGQVRVGRFTNQIGISPLHPLEDSAQSTASHKAANGRWSGQTQYTSPAFMGVQVWALNAQKAQNKFAGGGTGSGYLVTNNMSLLDTPANRIGTQRWANLGAAGVKYTNGPLFAEFYSVTDMQGQDQTKIGASYDLKVVKLFASQFNQKTDVQSSASAGLAAHKATEIAATVPYGNFLFQIGQFNASKDLQLGVTNGSTKASKTGWGATYDLSKRTKIVYAGSKTTDGVAAATANHGGLVTGTNRYIGLAHTF